MLPSFIVPQYRVRNIEIKPGLVLAPMSGVTCMAFRRLIREINPGAVGLLISEFISVEGLTRKGRRSMEMMRFHESERPFGIQIFGFDIHRMRDAALMAQDAGADLVDINCGCPAPKVVRKGGGCELMRQPAHLSEIFKAVKRAISVPLTMKMRSGWDEDSKNCVNVAKIAESEGVEAIAVHGRTRAQLYRGQADWEIIRSVVETVRIPVLGSGDVRDTDSARARLASGVSGLFIGRAALENPLVFRQIVQGRAGIKEVSEAEVIGIVERYVELLDEQLQPRASIGRIKQLVSQCARGYSWRKEILQAAKLEDQLGILRRARREAAEQPFSRSEESFRPSGMSTS